MNKTPIAILIATFVLAACTIDSTTTNIPVSTEQPTSTSIALSTSRTTWTPAINPPGTPNPSPTIRPTISASAPAGMGEGEISESGPWYYILHGDELWILDPATLGWQRFQGPYQVLPAPKGGKLAITWSSDDYWFFIDRLEVLDLSSMELSPVMAFEIIELYSAEDPLGNYQRVNDSWAVLSNSANLSWSSDGNLLAFSGVSGKDDSDLYMYDFQVNTLRQLSSGDSFAVFPRWLPSGEEILYAGVSSLNMGKNGSGYSDWVYWTVDILTGTNISLFAGINYGWENFIGWLRPDVALFDTGVWWCGRYGLRTINLATGESENLWTYSYDWVVYDASHRTVLISSSPSDNTGVSCPERGNPGTYLYNLDSQEVTKLPLDTPVLEMSFDDSIGAIVLYSEGEYYRVYADGAIELVNELGDLEHPAIYSPDGTSVATVDLNSLMMYDTISQRQLRFALPYNASGEVVWLPDTSGILVFQYSGKGGRVCFLELAVGDCREFPNLLAITPRDDFRISDSDGWILP